MLTYLCQNMFVCYFVTLSPSYQVELVSRKPAMLDEKRNEFSADLFRINVKNNVFQHLNFIMTC